MTLVADKYCESITKIFKRISEHFEIQGEAITYYHLGNVSTKDKKCFSKDSIKMDKVHTSAEGALEAMNIGISAISAG